MTATITGHLPAHNIHEGPVKRLANRAAEGLPAAWRGELADYLTRHHGTVPYLHLGLRRLKTEAHDEADLAGAITLSRVYSDLVDLVTHLDRTPEDVCYPNPQDSEIGSYVRHSRSGENAYSLYCVAVQWDRLSPDTLPQCLRQLADLAPEPGVIRRPDGDYDRMGMIRYFYAASSV